MTIQDDWRRVSFVEVRRDKPPAPDFCLTNLPAGSVGVVAAPAGIGKTSLLMQLGAAVGLACRWTVICRRRRRPWGGWCSSRPRIHRRLCVT